MILTGLIITLCTFVVMEGITWCTHKYIMHGFLWVLHKDHHHKDHDHPWERNDAFFLIFGIPSFLLILTGVNIGFSAPYFWIGLGIMFYGMCYLLVHDIFIHQRAKFFRKTRSVYFEGLRRAHKIHHKHLGKEEGECFGMLWVPPKYFREARQRLKAKQSSAA